jgi:hypothetical protein
MISLAAEAGTALPAAGLELAGPAYAVPATSSVSAAQTAVMVARPNLLIIAPRLPSVAWSQFI